MTDTTTSPTNSSKPKKNTWEEFNKFYVGLFFMLVAVVAGVVYIQNRDYNSTITKATAHISSVETIGRNCNDCHLGASFINLFSHPAIKGNDNVVNRMMDSAKIKRW